MTANPDPEPANFVFWIVLSVVLLLLDALVHVGYQALVVINDSALKRAADDGEKKAKSAMRLLSKPARFSARMSTACVLFNLATAFLPVFVFSEEVRLWASRLTDVRLLQALLFVAFLAVVVFTVLVFGELFPRRLGSHGKEGAAYALLPLIKAVDLLVALPAAMIGGAVNLLLRLCRIDPNADLEMVTEEEIRMMVDAGEEKGVIEESQKEMINNIFEFDDLNASDVMTHRTDIVAVDINDSFDDVIRLATEEGYSRIPAYEDDIDDIKGIVYVKDLLKYVGSSLPTGSLADLVRKPFFVPESKRCGDLFTEMTEKRIQMCIVADEFGGTAGLVTIEDLLESIVGSIQDEYDDEEEDEIEQINETTFTVDGTTDIDDINEELDIELPEGDYDTVGGMILSELGRIPQADEHPEVEACGYRFTVEEMGERRIEKVRIERLPEAEDEE